HDQGIGQVGRVLRTSRGSPGRFALPTVTTRCSLLATFMKLLSSPEIWFVCGSQHLYGPGPLQQVAANARQVAAGLAASKQLPLKTVFKALLTTPDEITNVMLAANNDANCAGLVLWMHTFSPS